MGDAETKARTLTTRLLALQQQHVPSQVYLSRPGDPAWFGFRCRASAAGQAMLPGPRLLKHCARELSAPLTTVFTSCLREKKWPTVWKEARVVPVHKKNSRSEPNNYRPISLLSVMGKLLEKIVAVAICQHLSENHLLSDRQIGCVKPRFVIYASMADTTNSVMRSAHGDGSLSRKQ
ncbi:uncharacterized protein LOC135109454 [Scylla paramamosain]|uniref:uncharacterized protein LOC135109454 n=1 Tax=Scylla paramamosain TaxID=85552 RepID=UPI0030826FF2